MGMTEKQARFVDEYLIDGNATQAAIRAGYKAKNADVMGPRVLGKPQVAAAIAAAREEASERAIVTAEAVFRGLLAEAQRTDEGSSHGARVSAWTTLAKLLGMLKDKVEHSGPAGGPVQVEVSDAKQRLAERLARAQRRPNPGTPGNPDEPGS